MPIPIDKSRRPEISVLLSVSQKILGRQDFAVVKIREVMEVMTAEALLEAERSFDALPMRVRKSIRSDAEAVAERGKANRAARQGRNVGAEDAGRPVMRPDAPLSDFIQSTTEPVLGRTTNPNLSLAQKAATRR